MSSIRRRRRTSCRVRSRCCSRRTRSPMTRCRASSTARRGRRPARRRRDRATGSRAPWWRTIWGTRILDLLWEPIEETDVPRMRRRLAALRREFDEVPSGPAACTLLNRLSAARRPARRLRLSALTEVAGGPSSGSPRSLRPDPSAGPAGPARSGRDSRAPQAGPDAGPDDDDAYPTPTDPTKPAPTGRWKSSVRPSSRPPSAG